MGILTLGDVARADTDLLRPVFGKNAEAMQKRCLGVDDNPVEENAAAKSISSEMSFAQDIESALDVEAALGTVCAKVARRMRRATLVASSVGVKVRFANRSVRSAQAPLPSPTDSAEALAVKARDLLDRVWAPGTRVRLVGVSAFGLAPRADAARKNVQLSLFDESESERDAKESSLDALAEATDKVKDRFGEQAVMFGREMRTMANLTGSSSKNPADYDR